MAKGFARSKVGVVIAPESTTKKVLDVLQVIMLLASFLVVLYLFFIIPTQVDGQSMEPTFQNDEVLFTNRLLQVAGGPSGVFRSYDYQRGDVIVYTREGEADLIKRIIGLEGERIRIEDNRVYINGVLLREDYIDHAQKPTQPGSFIAEGEEKIIPPGSYFTLGDNRTNSIDSRSSQVGFVRREQIRGSPFFQLLPLSELGFLERPDYGTLGN